MDWDDIHQNSFDELLDYFMDPFEDHNFPPFFDDGENAIHSVENDNGLEEAANGNIMANNFLRFVDYDHGLGEAGNNGDLRNQSMAHYGSWNDPLAEEMIVENPYDHQIPQSYLHDLGVLAYSIEGSAGGGAGMATGPTSCSLISHDSSGLGGGGQWPNATPTLATPHGVAAIAPKKPIKRPSSGPYRGVIDHPSHTPHKRPALDEASLASVCQDPASLPLFMDETDGEKKIRKYELKSEADKAADITYKDKRFANTLASRKCREKKEIERKKDAERAILKDKRSHYLEKGVQRLRVALPDPTDLGLPPGFGTDKVVLTGKERKAIGLPSKPSSPQELCAEVEETSFAAIWQHTTSLQQSAEDLTGKEPVVIDLPSKPSSPQGRCEVVEETSFASIWQRTTSLSNGKNTNVHGSRSVAMLLQIIRLAHEFPSGVTITFRHVHGHSGNSRNEEADQLAHEATGRKSTPKPRVTNEQEATLRGLYQRYIKLTERPEGSGMDVVTYIDNEVNTDHTKNSKREVLRKMRELGLDPMGATVGKTTSVSLTIIGKNIEQKN